MRFQTDTWLDHKIQPLAFDDIGREVLEAFLRDDLRVTGIMMELVMPTIFHGDLLLPHHAGAKYDVSDSQGRTYEVRTTSTRSHKRGSARLTPSSQQGIGRKYDPDYHLRWWEGLYGFIIVDATEFPHLKIIALSTRDLERISGKKLPKGVSLKKIREHYPLAPTLFNADKM